MGSCAMVNNISAKGPHNPALPDIKNASVQTPSAFTIQKPNAASESEKSKQPAHLDFNQLRNCTQPQTHPNVFASPAPLPNHQPVLPQQRRDAARDYIPDQRIPVAQINSQMVQELHADAAGDETLPYRDHLADLGEVIGELQADLQREVTKINEYLEDNAKDYEQHLLHQNVHARLDPYISLFHQRIGDASVSPITWIAFRTLLGPRSSSCSET